MRSLTIRFLGWALARMAPPPPPVTTWRFGPFSHPHPHPHRHEVLHVEASSPAEAWAVITEAA